MAEPEALLMDEPTSSLDPENRLGVEELVRGLADAGRPVIWVTHDLDQADRLADHCLVLVDGQVAVGPARDRFLAGSNLDRERTDDD
jgi:ABC-type multidrug transport system ATPase subunit